MLIGLLSVMAGAFCWIGCSSMGLAQRRDRLLGPSWRPPCGPSALHASLARPAGKRARPGPDGRARRSTSTAIWWPPCNSSRPEARNGSFLELEQAVIAEAATKGRTLDLGEALPPPTGAASGNLCRHGGRVARRRGADPAARGHVPGPLPAGLRAIIPRARRLPNSASTNSRSARRSSANRPRTNRSSRFSRRRAAAARSKPPFASTTGLPCGSR